GGVKLLMVRRGVLQGLRANGGPGYGTPLGYFEPGEFLERQYPATLCHASPGETRPCPRYGDRDSLAAGPHQYRGDFGFIRRHENLVRMAPIPRCIHSAATIR